MTAVSGVGTGLLRRYKPRSACLPETPTRRPAGSTLATTRCCCTRKECSVTWTMPGAQAWWESRRRVAEGFDGPVAVAGPPYPKRFDAAADTGGPEQRPAPWGVDNERTSPGWREVRSANAAISSRRPCPSHEEFAKVSATRTEPCRLRRASLPRAEVTIENGARGKTRPRSRSLRRIVLRLVLRL
jgi:hypothetical protein